MRNKIKAALGLAAILLFSCNLLNASESLIKTHIGFDMKWRYMSFKKDFGKHETKSSYIQPEPYLGIQLNDFLALQLGYAVGLERNLNKDVNVNDNVFQGMARAKFLVHTKTSFRGLHGNLVGILPINERLPLDLILSVGISNLHMKVKYREMTVAQTVALERHFTATKWIPKIQAGLQYMVTDQVGVRALVGWEQTSRFKNMKPKENPNSILRATVNDSITAGLGLFYRFN